VKRVGDGDDPRDIYNHDEEDNDDEGGRDRKTYPNVAAEYNKDKGTISVFFGGRRRTLERTQWLTPSSWEMTRRVMRERAERIDSSCARGPHYRSGGSGGGGSSSRV